MTDPPMYNVASAVLCRSLAIVRSLPLPGCVYRTINQQQTVIISLTVYFCIKIYKQYKEKHKIYGQVHLSSVDYVLHMRKRLSITPIHSYQAMLEVRYLDWDFFYTLKIRQCDTHRHFVHLPIYLIE